MDTLKKIMQNLTESINNSTASFNNSLDEISDWLAQDPTASPTLRGKVIEIAMMLNSLVDRHSELLSKVSDVRR